MRKFDTKVQHLKYKVLKEVARLAWNDTLLENLMDIPQMIIPGKTPTMRCCVYKERAIVAERVKLAMGGNKDNPNVIEVIEIACDECPMGGYEVTNACRGCLAHRCEDACKFGAIYFDQNHVAHIDKTKCRECGACSRVCPYSAIISLRRPCENACKIKAIHMSEAKTAAIDNKKCIACGACVYQCPFGAIMDKSYILDAIDIIKKSDNNRKYKVYAVVAPSISSQFTYAKLGQVITGLKELGFYTVIEAALGADMVAYSESRELVEKGFLISSCCPAFVSYVEKNFPGLAPSISHNLSPMATIAKYLKEREKNCKVIFIGPCTAKKAEVQKESVRPYVDVVLTFEELQALFDSKDIDITTLPEDVLDNASYYGRIFARSGGLTDAIAEGLKEHGFTDFELKSSICDGIEQCKVALMKKSKNMSDANFIEGMACVGGCIGGAGCLTHGEKDKAEVDKYGREAFEKTISDAISVLI
ncbi:iron hydrogenase 1 [Thermoclostridium stercorarium subsp. stercorarium DSM 8532]|jgi:[FeFe] hydrogenase (group B1/B3)|uniref:Iron hydrogenase 1 n=3 Tax=Thermoclostridium stercorarium TaxID=1510 RepID=L7VL23_THES1|nr:4Fe-4S dicluster domain-containing protein [Thermoclostridium stercorarium]AGC68855.1 iron hydrogenase 1 [Thermoclostridium stercorarium subsp. stercorarium DSM 8532]AGI39853.1 FhmA [Thermoclostridium stercorarium subsp. stercorarium DSM 8532]ANW99159.1 ferredoxin [Thermoclostridium stercorarium subsp. thermolacticum DSM 2910]ANX01720.1 ferredoxin [Thermoclostridium stercorarium subsp. leptospartum DSM 9219]